MKTKKYRLKKFQNDGVLQFQNTGGAIFQYSGGRIAKSWHQIYKIRMLK